MSAPSRVTGRSPRDAAAATFGGQIRSNRLRVAVALARERAADGRSPVRPLRGPARLLAMSRAVRGARISAYESILADPRQLVAFAPYANSGRGSWIELVGRLTPATRHVGLLVPGGSAYLTDANFDRYHDRAAGLVGAVPDGSLAIVVWTADGWPYGWLRESRSGTVRPLARALVRFAAALRCELSAVGSRATVTALGHSYGGAVVGLAERYGLDVDRVLHVASAGLGVWSPRQYAGIAGRPRYAMTAPGDWIGYVQGVPVLGHGGNPQRFPGVIRLAAGALPEDPTLPDELGVPLGRRAGTMITGRHAHSEVFVRYSDAWWSILHVLSGGVLTGGRLSGGRLSGGR